MSRSSSVCEMSEKGCSLVSLDSEPRVKDGEREKTDPRCRPARSRTCPPNSVPSLHPKLLLILHLHLHPVPPPPVPARPRSAAARRPPRRRRSRASTPRGRYTQLRKYEVGTTRARWCDAGRSRGDRPTSSGISGRIRRRRRHHHWRRRLSPSLMKTTMVLVLVGIGAMRKSPSLREEEEAREWDWDGVGGGGKGSRRRGGTGFGTRPPSSMPTPPPTFRHRCDREESGSPGRRQRCRHLSRRCRREERVRAVGAG